MAAATTGGMRHISSTAAALDEYKAPMNELNFLLNDVLDIQSHYKGLAATGGEHATPDMVDMVLQEMGKFCEQELSPLFEVADREGCTYVNEYEVKTPTGFKEAYDTFVMGGWQGLNYPEELGGQGLPYSLQLFATEMSATANWTWTMYPGLSKGAINTILSHGTDALKGAYLPEMVAGTWAGTMCLTEPQCGSDLAQVSTKAVPLEGDGAEDAIGQKYSITGTKIFISCGEHDLTDNIVHCVLARLPDAPEGTKGISLFAVPRRKVGADDGALGDLNGAKIGRIEDKMGCHGSSTCEINFENAEGYLIGEANKGLNHMFTFINTSRLGTAVQGVAAAELSFQNALWYAKDRLAMRSLTGVKAPDKPADPIIVHPDVRRMLLTQKCVAEGGRAMVAECALLNDLELEAKANGDDAAARDIDDRMGFLTPILKGFLTEVGVEAANLGIQVYGGHGYIRANKQEQILRDVRISAVWEGTTGIQALDLLGRKIMLGKLAPLKRRAKEVRGKAWDLAWGGSSPAVKAHAWELWGHCLEWEWLTMRVGLKAKKDRDAIGVASVDYLMYSGYVSLAYHWLLMEEAAAARLAGKGGERHGEELPEAFYESKCQASQFMFEHILPRTRAHAKSMFTPVPAIMDMKEDNFSFDY